MIVVGRWNITKYNGYHDDKIVVAQDNEVIIRQIKNNKFEHNGITYIICDNGLIYPDNETGRRVYQIIQNSKNKPSQVRLHKNGAITYSFYKLSLTVYPDPSKIEFCINSKCKKIDTTKIPENLSVEDIINGRTKVNTFSDEFTIASCYINQTHNLEKNEVIITVNASKIPERLELSPVYKFKKNFSNLLSKPEVNDLYWRIRTEDGIKKIPFIFSIVNVGIISNIIQELYYLDKSTPYESPIIIPDYISRTKYGTFIYHSPTNYTAKTRTGKIVAINNKKFVEFKSSDVETSDFSGKDYRTGEEIHIMPLLHTGQQVVLMRKMKNKCRIYGIVTGEGIFTIDAPCERIQKEEPVSVFEKDVKILATHVIFPYQLKPNRTTIDLGMKTVTIDGVKLSLPRREFSGNNPVISHDSMRRIFSKQLKVNSNNYEIVREYGYAF